METFNSLPASKDMDVGEAWDALEPLQQIWRFKRTLYIYKLSRVTHRWVNEPRGFPFRLRPPVSHIPLYFTARFFNERRFF